MPLTWTDVKETMAVFDVHSYVALLVFLVVVVCIVRPPHIRIPHWRKHTEGGTLRYLCQFHVDFAVAPLLGVLLLLAVGSVGVQQVADGILGSNPAFRPYAIIILVLSLAYVSISLDETGIFTGAAVWAAGKAGTSGRRFFVYIFLLCSVVTVFASNDVVVLTLTPILIYFCRFVRMDPVPFLMAEFHAANTLAAVLLIGNPTNISASRPAQRHADARSRWRDEPAVLL